MNREKQENWELKSKEEILYIINEPKLYRE